MDAAISEIQSANLDPTVKRKLRRFLANNAHLLVACVPGDVVSTLQEELQEGGPDTSAALCPPLITPPLQQLPSVCDLQRKLLSDLAVKLPLSRHAYACVHASSPHLLHHFQVAEGQLSGIVSIAVTETPTWGSEPCTAQAVSDIIIKLLQKLDNLLPSSQRIGLISLRDQGDADSLMTLMSSKGKSLRPDGQLCSKDGKRLLCKWEEKGLGHPLSDAVEDLCTKTSVWTPLYYGQLEQLLCFAAAGSDFQFYALKRGQPGALPISQMFDMNHISDRAEMVVAAVNLYRLLAKVDEGLARHVLPAAQDIVRDQLGYRRSLFFRTDRLSVQKRISPWSSYEAAWGVEFETLQRMYSLTRHQPGLVHAADGGPTLARNNYTVELGPIGLQPGDAKPEDELQAAAAAHGFLHGLQTLHEAGFVHRDLRWENIACDISRRRYFLLDLELCDHADNQPPFNLASWDSNTLVDGRYTQASDLHNLGQMLRDLLGRVILSAEGRSLVVALCQPASQHQYTISQLLDSAWVQCKGEHCRVAGANPLDMP